ncbi:MAG: pilus assembly protein [Acidimicrobiia bacterium]|nr:pilus assembly protein [Acidimicrobiia bacterium]
MMNKGYHMGEDRGATLVEAAIVLPIFFLLVFGLLEFGFGFKDWLTINHAAREGARISVAAADDVRADQLALEAVVEGLNGNMLDDVVFVTIGHADDVNPTDARTNQYFPASTACGWTPCPDIDDNPSFESDLNWPPSARDVEMPTVDRIKVTIEFTHEYLTGFIGDSVTWNASKVMRIEPQG